MIKERLLEIMEQPKWYASLKKKDGIKISRQHAYDLKIKVIKGTISEGGMIKLLRKLGEKIEIKIK